MYLIHNKYDKKSRDMLKTIGDDVVVIDFYSEREKGNNSYDFLVLPDCGMPSIVDTLIFNYPEKPITLDDIKTDTTTLQGNDVESQQRLTDLELQNLEAQAERQLMAQQLADLELLIMTGGVM